MGELGGVSRPLRLMTIANVLGMPLGMMSVALLAHLYGVGADIEMNLLAQSVPVMFGGVLEGNATVLQSAEVAAGAASDDATFGEAAMTAVASSAVAALALVIVSAATAPLVLRFLSQNEAAPHSAAIAGGLAGVMMGASVLHATATTVALARGEARSPAISRLVVRLAGLAALYPLFRVTREFAPNLAPAFGAVVGASVQLWSVRRRFGRALPRALRSVSGAFSLLFTDRRIVLMRLMDQFGSYAPAWLASRFPPGTYVVYAYAQKFAIPLTLVCSAVLTVLVPRLARSKAEAAVE
jgi:O-antigen/teichoic acid export membrane protein